MSIARCDQSVTTTEHGMLVPYGRFAKRVGVVGALRGVSFGMKTLVHSPADKILELLAHISSGGMHVNELGSGAHPLIQDRAVALAWGQESFASSSGVSALLHSISSEATQAVTSVLSEVLAPLRRRVLREVSASWLVVDLDLTGLVVSDQATTYEGADYGYMGEIARLGRGYQFARAQLATPNDAFVLGGFLHPGHTISAHCLKELVGLVETQLGQPRRRIAYVEARLNEAEKCLAVVRAKQASAKTPSRQASLQKRQGILLGEIEQLKSRQAELAADNAANLGHRRVTLRMDGGFGDSKSLIWLYEQGYDFVVRAHNQKTAQRLRKEVGLCWEKVSQNGFIAQSKESAFGDCPYPMRLFVCRQWCKDGRPERWSALVATSDLDPKEWPSRRIGTFYNKRQSIEAGIKESKNVFSSRHLPTRHKAGVVLYEQLVIFAQNLIRWFRRQALGNTPFAAASITELVRIGANSRAEIVLQQDATLLKFVGIGRWTGLALAIKTQVAWQLPLPLCGYT